MPKAWAYELTNVPAGCSDREAVITEMTTATRDGWKNEFGIEGWVAPTFFGSKQDVDVAVPPPPQAHAIRRAFDRLKLTGVVCFDNVPTVYFHEPKESNAVAEHEILRLFWNQGLAPILIVVTDTEARIHSSLTLPKDNQFSDRGGSLVRTLNRVVEASEIRQFIFSVQSGEFFRANFKSFDPKQRVDRELLRNLRATASGSQKAVAGAIDPQVLDALLCRLVFTCYLFDRGIIDEQYLKAIGINGARISVASSGEVHERIRVRSCMLCSSNSVVDLNGDLLSDDLKKNLST